MANLLLPTDLITCKDKIELLINTLEAIRRFRNCAAHSLNFFGCRSVYNIPGNILYTIVPNGVLKREKGKITSRDKKSLKGIYGVLIMTAILLNDKLLVSSLIAECRGVFKPEVSGDDDSKHIVDLINELKQKYKEATQIPIDFIDRLEIIYKSIT